jgi:hypothetical protein
MLTFIVTACVYILGCAGTIAWLWKYAGYVYDDEWGWILLFWPIMVFMIVVTSIMDFF